LRPTLEYLPESSPCEGSTVQAEQVELEKRDKVLVPKIATELDAPTRPGFCVGSSLVSSGRASDPEAERDSAWEKPRRGRPARFADTPAVGVQPSDENRFSVLGELPDNFMPPPPILTGANLTKYRRVASELHTHYKTRRSLLPPLPPPNPARSVSAAEIKVSIYTFFDERCPADIAVPWPKMCGVKMYDRHAFWARMALSRLRFLHDKRHYVKVRRYGKNAPTLLQLHVPPKGKFDPAHAAAQATYRDDGDVFIKGLRVDRERLREVGVPDADVAKLYSGYEVALHEWPAKYHGQNYGGALDYPDKLSDEIKRMLDAGFVEGPLLYVPHIVQGMGGVWKPEKQKWRTVMDATTCGVTPASLHLGADYDMLDAILRRLQPDQLMSGFDLTDAFCNWPYTPSHSDLWGFKDQASQQYFRYRFMAFGGCQSPAVQQHWARIIKDLVNKHGLRFCRPGSRAATAPGFSCEGAYLDDFHLHHSPGLSVSESTEQYESVLRLLEHLGITYKPSKCIWPTTECEYLGFVVDSVARTVGITAERAAALRAAIFVFCAQVRGGERLVQRRELARIIGRLQWTVTVLPHGQRFLRYGYDCLHALQEADRARPGLKAQWASDVRVQVTDACLRGLEAFAAELDGIDGRPIFLDNLNSPNGFWAGALPESDDQLDADGVEGVSAEDIEILTGDASGKMGGGWWRHERMAFEFPVDESAPFKSSNFRELKTALKMLEHWGPELQRRRVKRVLIRTDNITTAAAINKLSSRWPDLRPLAEAFADVSRRCQLQVRARHIRGLHNLLADRLSRELVLRATDYGDWRFRHDEFEEWERLLGRRFDTDACADPLGHNAHCERFHSRLDSTLSHSWARHHTWCNADWEILDEVLAHFRRGYAEAPHDTSALFIVPAWPAASWWTALKGMRLLAVYPTGSELFSAPPTVSDFNFGVPKNATLDTRRFLGATKWPVAVVYAPPALRHAGGERTLPGRGPGSQPDPAGSGGETDLVLRQPLLSGHEGSGAELLRLLPPRAVRRMRRAHF
jgi:hypothetical protein